MNKRLFGLLALVGMMAISPINAMDGWDFRDHLGFTFDESNPVKRASSDTQELLCAASEGNIVNLSDAIYHGADPDTVDRNGNTSLHLAALNGHEGIVNHLLEEKGIKANTANQDGNTPLHVAVLSNHEGIVSCLLNKKIRIDINKKNNDNHTSLYLATKLGKNNMIRLLLQDQRVKPNVFNDYKLSVGDKDYPNTNRHALQAPNNEPYEPTREPQLTALHLAARLNNIGAVQLLINNPKTDPNLEAKHPNYPVSHDYCPEAFHGFSPLHFACAHGHEEVVHLLLASPRINVNAYTIDEGNPMNGTPLATAVYCQQYGCAKLLLDNQEIDPNIYNIAEDGPLTLACMNWTLPKGQQANLELLCLLLSHPKTDVTLYGENEFGEYFDSLTLAVEQDDKKAVSILLQHPKIKIHGEYDSDYPFISDDDGSPFILYDDSNINENEDDSNIDRKVLAFPIGMAVTKSDYIKTLLLIHGGIEQIGPKMIATAKKYHRVADKDLLINANKIFETGSLLMQACKDHETVQREYRRAIIECELKEINVDYLARQATEDGSNLDSFSSEALSLKECTKRWIVLARAAHRRVRHILSTELISLGDKTDREPTTAALPPELETIIIRYALQLPKCCEYPIETFNLDLEKIISEII